MESRTPSLQLELPFEPALKVLLVEDHDDTRNLLEEFLRSLGYEFVSAESGREALEAVERDPELALVLLDVVVPEIGGLEVLSRIRACAPHLGVIVFTALADREIAQLALKLGAFDCIRKPLNLARLETSIVACLSHGEYCRQRWWRRLMPKGSD